MYTLLGLEPKLKHIDSTVEGMDVLSAFDYGPCSEAWCCDRILNRWLCSNFVLQLAKGCEVACRLGTMLRTAVVVELVLVEYCVLCDSCLLQHRA